MKGTQLLLSLCCIGAVGLVGVVRMEEFSHQVGRLERQRAGEPSHLNELQRELRELRGELELARAEIDREGSRGTQRVRRSEEAVRELEQRLASAQATLDACAEDLHRNGQRLDDLSAERVGPEVIEARFEELDTSLSDQWSDLSADWSGIEELAAKAASQAEANRNLLEALDQQVHGAERDLDRMWEELMGPVVQLAGDTSVGSGILLESRERPDGSGWDTFLVTAWHVVRDIQGSLDNREMPVPVTIYRATQGVEYELAALLEFDPAIDVALLRLETDRRLPHGARLAPRARIQGARIFEGVYAVGCPLGNDPIPTAGEVASTHHWVDGASYWMINAPTYIGNSGGGIFDAETHALLGIFSKIYNYGSLRPTIVPHMGLVTPLDRIYDWLDSVGYGSLVPADGPAELASARVR